MAHTKMTQSCQFRFKSDVTLKRVLVIEEKLCVKQEFFNLQDLF